MPPLPLGAVEGVRQSSQTPRYGIVSFGPGGKSQLISTNRSNSSKAESKRYQNTTIEEEDGDYDLFKMAKSPPSSKLPHTDRAHHTQNVLESNCTFSPEYNNKFAQPLMSVRSSPKDPLDQQPNGL